MLSSVSSVHFLFELSVKRAPQLESNCAILLQQPEETAVLDLEFELLSATYPVLFSGRELHGQGSVVGTGHAEK